VEIIRGLINLKPHHRGCVATIGNFDGVHLGHQAILREVTRKSAELGVPSMLVLFEPQPQEFFNVFDAPARLTRFREKIELLAEQGLDLVLCFQFNEKTRSTTADEFVGILGEQIGIRALYVGDDFRFGSDRKGDFEFLQAAGSEHGFEVTNLHTLSYEDIRVSSTNVRECLERGNFEKAEAMLGRPYSILGKVIHGRQLGRELGTPTANIQLHRYRAPIDGVYAVEVDGLDRPYQGVANVGVRPTLNDGNVIPILEVHIFDFAETIYGKCVKVIFRHKIRAEQKFDGLDALRAAIQSDMEAAREFFEDQAA
jgi:riboflavin kinase/FMN adenylyltransferase